MKHIRFLLLLALVTLSSCREGSYKLYVLFDNVEGLAEDSKVTSSGYTIGRIESMKLHKNGVLAELRFDNDVKIPQGSAFSIITPGLISPPQIDVELDYNKKAYYKSGDLLIGKTRGSLLEEKAIPDSLAVEKLRRLIDTLAKHKEH